MILAVNPATGQSDYSMAWVEYYRSQGMHFHADAILAQARGGAGQAAQPGQPGPPGQQQTPPGQQPQQQQQQQQGYQQPPGGYPGAPSQ